MSISAGAVTAAGEPFVAVFSGELVHALKAPATIMIPITLRITAILSRLR